MFESFVGKWAELKVLLESSEKDIEKMGSGNAAAGTRTRKNLRNAKKLLTELVKISMTVGKDKKPEEQQKSVNQ